MFVENWFQLFSRRLNKQWPPKSQTDINDNVFERVKELQLFLSQFWNFHLVSDIFYQTHLITFSDFTSYSKWRALDDCRISQISFHFKLIYRYLLVSHLDFSDVCCCLVDWTLMAPRWADRWGEFLGEGFGEILGDECDVGSWGQGSAAGEAFNVGVFLGMRLRRWLIQRCCSSAELASSSSSLALDMS